MKSTPNITMNRLNILKAAASWYQASSQYLPRNFAIRVASPFGR